jgi:alpha-glucoside transport system substrate-binding protein
MASTLRARVRGSAALAALGIACTLVLSSCASANDSSASSSGSAATEAKKSALPAGLVKAALAQAKTAAGGADLKGETVDVLGIVAGDEAKQLTDAMQPFEDATGVKIKYTGSQDQATVLAAGVKSGNAPDVVDAQGAGLAMQYAKSGDAVPLDDIVGTAALKRDYNQGLLDAVSYNGKTYGLWGETDTFQIWYAPKTYTGPTTGSWQQLTAWADAQAKKNDGNAPWCMAMEAGAGSGFPGQSWIENVFVKKYGAAKLADWASGELAWTSPEVTWAWKEFGKVAASDTLVSGGPQAVVSTSAFSYSKGMYTQPQRCQLTLWGNYAGSIIQGIYPKVTIPDDLDFFTVPASDPAYSGDLDVTGHVTFAMNQDPATTAFLKYWETAAAQSLVAASGNWTLGNKNVPLSAYPNVAMKQSAQLLQSATTLIPGPAGTVGSATNSAYNAGIMSYIQDPGKLSSILQTIQKTAGE